MDRWITKQDAVELYDTLNDDNIDQACFNYRDRTDLFDVRVPNGKKRGQLYINIGKLESERDELLRLWNISHDYYYYLTYVCEFSHSQLARALEADTEGFGFNTWMVYLGSEMFKRLDDKSLLALSAEPSKLRPFIEWCETAIPEIHKTLKPNKERMAIWTD